jgi:hypothetical protein
LQRRQLFFFFLSSFFSSFPTLDFSSDHIQILKFRESTELDILVDEEESFAGARPGIGSQRSTAADKERQGDLADDNSWVQMGSGEQRGRCEVERFE